MKKDIKKLMKKNNFEVERVRKHIVWRHKFTNKKVVTSVSPSCGRTTKNIRRDIKSALRGTPYKIAA